MNKQIAPDRSAQIFFPATDVMFIKIDRYLKLFPCRIYEELQHVLYKVRADSVK